MEFQHGVDPLLAGVISALGAVLAFLGTRMVGRAALENALTATAKEMLGQLRQELKVAIRERDRERKDSEALREEIKSLQRLIDSLELRVASATLPRPAVEE